MTARRSPASIRALGAGVANWRRTATTIRPGMPSSVPRGLRGVEHAPNSDGIVRTFAQGATILSRTHRGESTEHPREVTLIVEARSQGDLGKAHVGIRQPSAGAGHATPPRVLADRAPE